MDRVSPSEVMSNVSVITVEWFQETHFANKLHRHDSHPILHVGNDIALPTILAHSVRAQNPNARIIHCTDSDTPAVRAADEVRRMDGDTGYLMVYRLQCFSRLGLTEPAIYPDTDMICVTPLDPKTLLDRSDTAVCERNYEVGEMFRTDHPHPDLTRRGWTFS